MNFYGRKETLKTFRSLQENRNGIVVLTGRRRIGKTALAEHFSKNFSDIFSFRGTFTKDSHLDRVNSKQLSEVSLMFSNRFQENHSFTNWHQFFGAIKEKIVGCKNPIVILDEISWMARGDEFSFKSALVIFCDFINNNDHIFMIISGSVSHWIRNELEKDSAFLHRFTHKEVLEPLSLQESSNFWKISSSSKTDIIKTVSALGGIPKYLKTVDYKLDFQSNLKNFYFSKNSLGQSEFDQIFTEILGDKETFKKIVITLSKNKMLSLPDLRRLVKYKANPENFNKMVDVLLINGYIEECTPWSFKTSLDMTVKYYRLSDPYLRFYLNYVHDKKPKIIKEFYSLQSIESLENWDTIMGFQFENLVLNNQKLIFEKLNLLNGVKIENAGPYERKGKKEESGVQIDYLIDTERNYYICEMKMKKEIGSAIVEELELKKKKLMPYLAKGKGVYTVLVYSGELSGEEKIKKGIDFIINMEDFI